ncbi:hypothetical protein H5410_001695, partial [Solanum commersonii]
MVLFVYRIGGYVLFALFGLLLILFGTYGRDRRYLAPRDCAAVSWAHHAILAGKEKRRLRFSSYRFSGSSIPQAFKEWNIIKHPSLFRIAYLWFYLFLASGFHGFHVIIGTIFSIICDIKPISWSSGQGASALALKRHLMLAFCRRGSVIPICLYLLMGRYMKEGIGGLRNGFETKRIGPFKNSTCFPTPFDYHIQKVSSTFLPNLSLLRHINEGVEEIMADHVHARNDPKLDLGLFEIVPLIAAFHAESVFSVPVERFPSSGRLDIA